MSIIKDYLIPVSGVQFQDQVASKWSPQPGVMLDPSVQFGETCIHDTRIPTRATCGPGCVQPGTRARSSDEPSLCPPPRPAWNPRSTAPLRTPLPTSPVQFPSGRCFKPAPAHSSVRGEPARSPSQGRVEPHSRQPPAQPAPPPPSRRPQPGPSTPIKPRAPCHPDHAANRAQSRLLRLPCLPTHRITLEQIPLAPHPRTQRPTPPPRLAPNPLAPRNPPPRHPAQQGMALRPTLQTARTT